MDTQPDYESTPKFALGEMAIYGGAIVRVLGREQFIPGNMWFYMLGAKVGKTKMKWHHRIPEFELVKPCWENVTELDPSRGKKWLAKQ